MSSPITLSELIFQIIRGLFFIVGIFLLILISTNSFKLLLDWKSNRPVNIQNKKILFRAIYGLILVIVLLIAALIIGKIVSPLSAPRPLPLPYLRSQIDSSANFR